MVLLYLSAPIKLLLSPTSSPRIHNWLSGMLGWLAKLLVKPSLLDVHNACDEYDYEQATWNNDEGHHEVVLLDQLSPLFNLLVSLSFLINARLLSWWIVKIFAWIGINIWNIMPNGIIIFLFDGLIIFKKLPRIEIIIVVVPFILLLSIWLVIMTNLVKPKLQVIIQAMF